MKLHSDAICEKIVELRNSSKTMQPQFTCAFAWKAYPFSGLEIKYVKSP